MADDAPAQKKAKVADKSKVAEASKKVSKAKKADAENAGAQDNASVPDEAKPKARASQRSAAAGVQYDSGPAQTFRGKDFEVRKAVKVRAVLQRKCSPACGLMQDHAPNTADGDPGGALHDRAGGPGADHHGIGG